MCPCGSCERKSKTAFIVKINYQKSLLDLCDLNKKKNLILGKKLIRRLIHSATKTLFNKPPAVREISPLVSLSSWYNWTPGRELAPPSSVCFGVWNSYVWREQYNTNGCNISGFTDFVITKKIYFLQTLPQLINFAAKPTKLITCFFFFI